MSKLTRYIIRNYNWLEVVLPLGAVLVVFAIICWVANA